MFPNIFLKKIFSPRFISLLFSFIFSLFFISSLLLSFFFSLLVFSLLFSRSSLFSLHRTLTLQERRHDLSDIVKSSQVDEMTHMES